MFNRLFEVIHGRKFWKELRKCESCHEPSKKCVKHVTGVTLLGRLKSGYVYTCKNLQCDICRRQYKQCDDNRQYTLYAVQTENQHNNVSVTRLKQLMMDCRIILMDLSQLLQVSPVDLSNYINEKQAFPVELYQTALRTLEWMKSHAHTDFPSIIAGGLDNVRYAAVDFDGCIVENAFPEIGKPNEKVLEFLRLLVRKGVKLVLWTSRVNGAHRKYLDEAIEECKRLGLPLYGVNYNPDNEKFMMEHAQDPAELSKIYCDIYIDDRSVSVQDILNFMKNRPGEFLEMYASEFLDK